MRDADRIREQPPQSQTWGTVVMTLAAVVGLCGVFAMGYTIGRRVERSVPCQVPPAQATRQVTDRLDLERQTHNELTFYDALMGEPTAQTASKAGAQAAAKSASKAAAAGAVASSAHVAGKSPPSPKPAAPSPKVQGAPGQASASAGAQAEKAAQAAAGKGAQAPQGTYTLQVSSVRRRDEAQALASAMTRQGLQAYITAATIPAKGTWYRVRVGHYDSVQAANVAKANLAQSDIPAWVLRID